MEMETVYFIVTIVCFIIIGCHQHHYIKTLKVQLDSQNKAIVNLKMHVDIFEPEKVKEFVNMRETTFKDKKEKEIDKIKSEMLEMSKDSNNTIEQHINEYIAALKFILRLSYFVHPNIRQSILEGMTDSETINNLLKDIKDVPYYSDDFANALKKATIQLPIPPIPKPSKSLSEALEGRREKDLSDR